MDCIRSWCICLPSIFINFPLMDQCHPLIISMDMTCGAFKDNTASLPFSFDFASIQVYLLPDDDMTVLDSLFHLSDTHPVSTVNIVLRIIYVVFSGYYGGP